MLRHIALLNRVILNIVFYILSYLTMSLKEQYSIVQYEAALYEIQYTMMYYFDKPCHDLHFCLK